MAAPTRKVRIISKSDVKAEAATTAAMAGKGTPTTPLPKYWHSRYNGPDLLETLLLTKDEKILREHLTLLHRLYVATYKPDPPYRRVMDAAFNSVLLDHDLNSVRTTVHFMFMLALISGITEWKEMFQKEGSYIRLDPFLHVFTHEFEKMILNAAVQECDINVFTAEMRLVYLMRYDPYGVAKDRYFTEMGSAAVAATAGGGGASATAVACSA